MENSALKSVNTGFQTVSEMYRIETVFFKGFSQLWGINRKDPATHEF